jgi:sugar phosphate isomerase/epimerase
MTNYDKWITAVSTSHTDYEFLKRLKDCGIDGMELSVGWQKCDDINWSEFRKNADQAGMKIFSYHLPFSNDINIADPVEERRVNAVKYQQGLMRKAAAVGIDRFIIHPSAEPIPVEERPEWMAASKISLKELVQTAAELNSVLCIEDLPRSCLGHNAAEMLELVAVDDRLRVCFDVNHLLTGFGTTHTEFVEKLGHLIVTTHMSDYDFIDEKHFFPGYGMINWKEVVELLENADYSGPFLYEGGFEPSARAPEVPHGTYEMARERHLTIKELCGK